jgi:hypothetical protein
VSSRQFKIFCLSLLLASTALLFNNCAQPSDDQNSSSEEAYVAPATIGRLASKIEFVTSEGKVSGYAMDSKNSASILKVQFYLGGDYSTGTYVGEVIAKDKLVGVYSGHYFTFQLPVSYGDGKPKFLYAYALAAKPEWQMSPGKVDFTFYAPKAEDFFNSNIAAHIAANACTRCHDWTYRTLMYGPLTSPTPAAGGSQTNNKFIRKMSGIEGHAGGNFCSGGINSGFCADIQTWWRSEFQ